jgi:hypothetical protein
MRHLVFALAALTACAETRHEIADTTVPHVIPNGDHAVPATPRLEVVGSCALTPPPPPPPTTTSSTCR